MKLLDAVALLHDKVLHQLTKGRTVLHMVRCTAQERKRGKKRTAKTKLHIREVK